MAAWENAKRAMCNGACHPHSSTGQHKFELQRNVAALARPWWQCVELDQPGNQAH